MVERMLDGVEVRWAWSTAILSPPSPISPTRTIYCGPIDDFYDFKLGKLEYRSLRFESETLDEENHQGVAVVNYNEREVPYTRIIEHKHFEFGTQPKTVITREYPADWKPGDEPYYPINDERNTRLYQQYKELAEQEGNVVFAGRLGGYKYYDMDKAIAAAFDLYTTFTVEMCKRGLTPFTHFIGVRGRFEWRRARRILLGASGAVRLPARARRR